MRGAPHSGLATLISRMSWRISSGVLGRPPRGLDFQRHQARNPARCHLMMVSGSRCKAARDRNGPATAYQINLRRSPIGVIIARFAGDRQLF
jgi:hypothetical protein